MKGIFGKGKDDVTYNFQFKFHSISGLTKNAGIEKFSISWERNDKKKNGNSPAYTLSTKVEEFTFDFATETTSTFNTKETKHKPVHFFIRDDNDNQKKKFEKILHLSEFIDGDNWCEKKDEWELIGWSNRHPNAKIKLIIRSWPEGSINLGIQKDIDEKEKTMLALKEKMRLEKEKKEKEKLMASMTPEEREAMDRKEKEKDADVEKQKLDKKKRQEQLEREMEEEEERERLEELEKKTKSDRDALQKKKDDESRLKNLQGDDDDDLMNELLKKGIPDDEEPVVDQSPKRISMKKPIEKPLIVEEPIPEEKSVQEKRIQMKKVTLRGAVRRGVVSDQSDSESKVEDKVEEPITPQPVSNPTQTVQQSFESPIPQPRSEDAPKRFSLNRKPNVTTDRRSSDAPLQRRVSDGIGDGEDILAPYEWEEVTISKLYKIDLNFVIEKDYDAEEELSKIEVDEKPVTFYLF
jgi:hypothetical protein